jgi:hypothetical protein
VYSKFDRAATNVESLISTAFNNVKEGLDHTCVELDLSNPDGHAESLAPIIKGSWNFPGILVISDEIWHAILNVLGISKASEKSGYRHVVSGEGSRVPMFFIKVNPKEINLNQLSGYIKWLVVECEYYEHRKDSHDVDWAWDPAS